MSSPNMGLNEEIWRCDATTYVKTQNTWAIINENAYVHS